MLRRGNASLFSPSRSRSRSRSPGCGQPAPLLPITAAFEGLTLAADLPAAPLPPGPRTETETRLQRADRLGVCKKWLEGYCFGGTCHHGRHPRWQGTTDLFRGAMCPRFWRGGCESRGCYCFRLSRSPDANWDWTRDDEPPTPSQTGLAAAAPLPPGPKPETETRLQRADRLRVCKKWLEGQCFGTCPRRHPRWQGTTDLFQGVMCQSFWRGGCQSEDCYRFHLSRGEYVQDLTWLVGEADANWDWTRTEPPTPSQSRFAAATDRHTSV
jgi:hypothetical protein